MSRILLVQPAAHVDNITADGHQLTKTPYPFYITEAGDVLRQDFWAGTVLKAVGFQRDLAVRQIDLWWEDMLSDPQQAVGMYLVTADKDGRYGSQQTAVDSIVPMDGEQGG